MSGPWDDYKDESGPWSEYQDSVSDSPLETAAAGAARAAGPGLAEFSRQVLPTAGGMAGAASGAALGAPLGPIGAGLGALGGAYLGGFGGQSIQTAWEAATNQRGQYTPAEAVAEANRAGMAQVAGEVLGMGAGGIARAAAPGLRKVGTQVLRATAGVPEREGAAVFRDPSILGRAGTVEEAAKAYKAGTGGLSGGVEQSRALFRKSYLNPEQAANAFDEFWPMREAMTTEEMLTLRQRMSKAASETTYKQGELKRVLLGNIDEIDKHLEGVLPDWSGGKQAYREAKVAEQFKSWLPLNRNLSPNVLRTWTAASAAGYGLAQGAPAMAAALPLISPKVWGYGIRAASAGAPVAAQGLDALTRIALGQYANPEPTVTR